MGCYGRKKTGNQDCSTYAGAGDFGFQQRAGRRILDKKNIWESQGIWAYKATEETIDTQVGLLKVLNSFWIRAGIPFWCACF